MLFRSPLSPQYSPHLPEEDCPDQRVKTPDYPKNCEWLAGLGDLVVTVENRLREHKEKLERAEAKEKLERAEAEKLERAEARRRAKAKHACWKKEAHIKMKGKFGGGKGRLAKAVRRRK